MALSQALHEARRKTATIENRMRQHRAELRLTEIIKVSGIADAYERADRKGDLRIETAFAAIYQSATTETLRDLVTRAYLAWQDDERAEEASVRGGVDGAVLTMKSHNPAFIEGAFVPDGDGAAA